MDLCAAALAVCFSLLACGSNATQATTTPDAGNSAVPAITAISPATAPAGGPALVLTVTGSNFETGSTLQWNGSARTTTVSSASQLQANLSAADLQLAQTANVTVVNSGSGGGSSNSLPFTVVADKIVFSSNRALAGGDAAAAHKNLWSMDPDGLNQAPLTTLLSADSFGALRSPDGRKVAFFSNRSLSGVDAASGAVNLWVINSDGTLAIGLTQLTFAGGTAVHSFAWSPDSSKIAYSCACATDGSDAPAPFANLWMVNADGSGQRALTTLTKAAADTPSWSPDGSKIAFSSFRALDGSDAAGPAENLWLIGADGSAPAPVTRLTVTFGNVQLRHGAPRWSPDGQRLTFSSNRALDGGNAFAPTLVFNVWTIAADGSAPTPVTRLVGVSSADGRWSPDGSRLAFASNRGVDGSDTTNPNSNIWVVATAGTGLLDLTASSTATASILEWAPNGTHLRFFSNQALDGSNATIGVTNLWRVDPDGANKVALTRLTVASAAQ